jgi:hypothetical protein
MVGCGISRAAVVEDDANGASGPSKKRFHVAAMSLAMTKRVEVVEKPPVAGD